MTPPLLASPPPPGGAGGAAIEPAAHARAVSRGAAVCY